MTPIEQQHLNNLCGQAGIDTAEIDPQITYYENKQHLQSLDLRGKTFNYTQEEAQQIEQQQEPPGILAERIRTSTAKSKCYIIVGAREQGKTALAYHLLEHHKPTTRPCYVFRHPNPPSLPSWIENLTMFTDKLPIGAIIFCDEAHQFFSQYDNRKKTNRQLAFWLTTARHRHQSLILSTQNTRFINLNLMELVDVILIKKPGLMAEDEERPTIRRLINEFNVNQYDVTQFLWYDKDEALPGCFDKPTWFTDELSKSYAAFVPEKI